MGWKILLPQEIMSEGRELLEKPVIPSFKDEALKQLMSWLISRNISQMP